ncbi:MAG: PHB depolymerase family esterase [Vicinamibacterales bacterium]
MTPGLRHVPRLVLALVAIALAAPPDAPLRAQPARPRGEVRRTLSHGGRTRTYQVYDYGRDTPAPVVVVLHGGGGNAENAVRMTGFNRIAERDGAIAVYPDGTAGRAGGRLLTWNAGHCCAAAMRNRVDDVGFIGALIDALVAGGRADASRIYVTGMSNGAMMAHRLGRELSMRIAAIAPVVGAVFGDEPPPRAPMPAYIVVGAEDDVVPAAGGPLHLRALLGGRSAADRSVAPAVAQATYWATHDGCGEPTRSTSAAAETSAWTSCRSGASVVYQRVAGNGHAWPGGRPGRRGAAEPTTAFDATAEIWAFFRNQRRPSPAR